MREADPRPRLLLLPVLALLLVAAGPARALDLPELMTLLSGQKSGQARFSEERHVKGLDQPLQASGTLAFVAPDRLTRHQLQPRDELMQVEGNTLTLKRGTRSRQLAVDATPEMLPLIEAMRGTLAGDLAALQRHFETTLTGAAERWTLDLRPLDRRAGALVRSVRVVGQRGVLRVVELELADGDRSVMTIDPLPPR